MANEIVATIDNDNDVLVINFADSVLTEQQAGPTTLSALTARGATVAATLDKIFPKPADFYDPIYTLAHNPNTELFFIQRISYYLNSYRIRLLTQAQVDFAIRVIRELHEEQYIDATAFATLSATLAAQPAKIAAAHQLEAEIKAVSAECTLTLNSDNLERDLQKLTALNNNEPLTGISTDATTGTITLPLLRVNVEALFKYISTQGRNDNNKNLKIISKKSAYDFAFLQTMLKKHNKGEMPDGVTINEGVLTAPLSLNTFEPLLYFIRAAAKNDPTPLYTLQHNANDNTLNIIYNRSSDDECDYTWLDKMLKEANNNKMPSPVGITATTRSIPLTPENAKPLFRFIKEMCGAMAIADLAACMKALAPILPRERSDSFSYENYAQFSAEISSASSTNNNNNVGNVVNESTTYQM